MVDNRMMVNSPLNAPAKTGRENNSRVQNPAREKQTSFADVLKKRLKEQEKIEFSRHAEKRMLSRGIELTEKSLDRLTRAVEKAENKGAKDSLIMVDEVAYLVSVENKTVVTAVDDESMKENVFTNIDSAVFM